MQAATCIYVAEDGRADGRALSVQRLELSAGTVTLKCWAPDTEEHDLRTADGLQVGCGLSTAISR